MDLIANLGLGFATAATPTNLLYCFLGCVLGTLIGVLPGIGPAATVAMLLPATFALDPTASVIMLAGIYYGAQYGGSTTAILINLPGEATSVVTALDGHQMARQGRAGTALAVAAIGSFIAGTIGTVVVAALAPALAKVALAFGPAEYFALMVLGLVVSVALAQGSPLKAIAMVLTGLLLGTVGLDATSGQARFTFGQDELLDGVGLVGVAMGMFGLAEIIANLQTPEHRAFVASRIARLMPNRSEMKQSAPPILRGTALGVVLGVLPGGGALLASFASYSLEKKLSGQPERFGQGAIEGVAGPEAANNAGAQTSFVPMLTLGIPANATMALLTGALLIQGIRPGPAIMEEQPALFWGLIASMWIGNGMLLVLNLPLIGLWVRLLTVPYRFLYPAIMVFCAIGVFSLSNSTFDVWIMVAFGLFGVVCRLLDCEPAPLLLGMVLGPMLEENFRRALVMSRGDAAVFVTQPISAALLLTGAAALLVAALPAIRRTLDEALKE